MKQYYIGMDMGGTFIKVALFDKDMKKSGEVRMPTGSLLGSDYVTAKMTEAAEKLLEKPGQKQKR